MTISLSNISPENKKVISIKKVSEIFEEKPKEEIVQDDEVSLHLKVDQLKNEIDELQQQKEKVLQDLQEAIAKEKETWEEEKEIEREEAQEIGYKVGYDAGYEQVFKQYDSLLEEANNIVHLAKSDYDKTVSKHENAIINLAISIAEKIMITSIEEEPEYFKHMVESAILDLKDSSNVKIYVHPNKYELIMEQKEELEQMVRNDDVISVYLDSNMHENACVIKHPYGQIDASIDTQLQQIKDALEEKIMER